MGSRFCCSRGRLSSGATARRRRTQRARKPTSLPELALGLKPQPPSEEATPRWRDKPAATKPGAARGDRLKPMLPGRPNRKSWRGSGEWVEDDNGLVGAGDNSFGDGEEFILLAEDTEARRLDSLGIELGGGAGRQFRAARLYLGNH